MTMSGQLPAVITLIVTSLLSVGAFSTPISVSGYEVFQYSPLNTLTTTNPSNATDGNSSTGFFVETARDNVNFPTAGLGGFEIRWDFDLSSYASISQFTFNFTGTLNDPSSIDAMLFRPIATTVQPSQNPDNYTEFAMTDGDKLMTTIVFTDGAALPKNDFNAFLSGDILSIYASTKFGSSSPQSISLTTWEVSADVIGESINSAVPAPATLWLLLVGLLGIAIRKSGTDKLTLQGQ